MCILLFLYMLSIVGHIARVVMMFLLLVLYSVFLHTVPCWRGLVPVRLELKREVQCGAVQMYSLQIATLEHEICRGLAPC